MAQEGINEFKLYQGKKASAQLLINGETLARKRVAAPAAPGRIYLRSGLNRFRLQVVLGKALVFIKPPSAGEFAILTSATLARPATPDVVIAGKGQLNTNDYEAERWSSTFQQCFFRNSAIFALSICPFATSSTISSSWSSVQFSSAPFKSRKTNAANAPVRLLPSMKGWF